MPFTVGLALALSAAFNTQATEPALQTAPQAQTLKEYVVEYFADQPIMVDIAQCESHFRQFNKNGAVYRGTKNNQDVGVMQINEHYHLDTAKKMGIDIYTIPGNVAYARYLFEKEGTVPWASSEACWGKTQNAKVLALASK
ncbi:MAG: hypothetical protein Q7S26_03035 [bacterium]|nr:hypothetical protein [bacterium]